LRKKVSAAFPSAGSQTFHNSRFSKAILTNSYQKFNYFEQFFLCATAQSTQKIRKSVPLEKQFTSFTWRVLLHQCFGAEA
jgi:hypothetical protein